MLQTVRLGFEVRRKLSTIAEITETFAFAFGDEETALLNTTAFLKSSGRLTASQRS